MKVSKQAQLGILITFTIAILIWGISFLKDNDIFKQYATYHVYYDRIDGLETSNKVILNGFQIGKVSDIYFAPDNSGRLIVSFSARETFKIPHGSTARIVSSDIMGTKSIEIIFGKSDVFYQSNDTLPGSIESDLKEQVSMQILPLKNKAEELIATIDTAMSALTVILNDKARENLSMSFANLNSSIKNIESITSDFKDIVGDEKNDIKQSLANINTITTTFSNSSDDLKKTLEGLGAFSDTLANLPISPVLNNLAQVTDQMLSVLQKLNSDNNSAGLLFNDDNLYYSIKSLSDNLASLTKDIQQNPKRYVQVSAFDFGKEVYINTKDNASTKGIVFMVRLTTSLYKIELSNFKGLNVEEYFSKNTYSYLTGATSKYSEVESTYNNIKNKYPKAEIIALKNGKLIKLEKALKAVK